MRLATAALRRLTAVNRTRPAPSSDLLRVPADDDLLAGGRTLRAMGDDHAPGSAGSEKGTVSSRMRIPRDRVDDYTRRGRASRRTFVQERTGVALEHVAHHSLQPSELPGNVEHFLGVAQVPIGLAGPLLVDGEHAQGEFYVPLATTEGTLVASYNRGMKLLHAAGGVRTTILDDRMQRAPAFVFESAREARAFGAVARPRTSARSAGSPRAPRGPGACAGSSSTPPAGSCSRALTTAPATRRARTSPEGPPRPPARGSWPTTRASPTSTWSRTSRPTRRAPGQHPEHPRQARRGRGHDPGRADRAAHAHERRGDVPRPAGLEPRRLHVRGEQQRAALRQRRSRRCSSPPARTQPTSRSHPRPSASAS